MVKIFQIMAKTYAGQNSKCSVQNFLSILLNMSQLTDKVTRYRTCRYHMSSRQKNTKKLIKLPLMYQFCSNSWQMLLRSRIVFVNASLAVLFCSDAMLIDKGFKNALSPWNRAPIPFHFQFYPYYHSHFTNLIQLILKLCSI